MRTNVLQFRHENSVSKSHQPIFTEVKLLNYFYILISWYLYRGNLYLKLQIISVCFYNHPTLIILRYQAQYWPSDEFISCSFLCVDCFFPSTGNSHDTTCAAKNYVTIKCKCGIRKGSWFRIRYIQEN